MEPTQLPPNPNPDAAPSADDHLLEDLASLTGLFNPELIWQKEENLDDLSEHPDPDAAAEAGFPPPHTAP